MAGINFTRKGLKQQIFSSKAVRATVGAKSSAFRGIMENKVVRSVINTAGERRVFYRALRNRGLQSHLGVNKKVLKEVLGDIEHSGQFSHSEMHHLGAELIGGSASSRIIRDHSKPHAQEVVHAVPASVHENPAQSRRQGAQRQRSEKNQLRKPDAPAGKNSPTQSVPAGHFNLESEVHSKETIVQHPSREHEQTINHFGVREDSEKVDHAKDRIAQIMEKNNDNNILDKAA